MGDLDKDILISTDTKLPNLNGYFTNRKVKQDNKKILKDEK